MSQRPVVEKLKVEELEKASVVGKSSQSQRKYLTSPTAGLHGTLRGRRTAARVERGAWSRNACSKQRWHSFRCCLSTECTSSGQALLSYEPSFTNNLYREVQTQLTYLGLAQSLNVLVGCKTLFHCTPGTWGGTGLPATDGSCIAERQISHKERDSPYCQKRVVQQRHVAERCDSCAWQERSGE